MDQIPELFSSGVGIRALLNPPNKIEDKFFSEHINNQEDELHPGIGNLSGNLGVMPETNV